jgi:nucleoside-diphosphate-sugar epimerase
MKNVLLTGANGFIGSAIMRRLQRDACPVRGVLRANSSAMSDRSEYVKIEGLSRDTDWGSALDGVEVVIHTAARVHIMQDSAADPLKQYLEVNLDGTLNLAKQAAAAAVRRFIFISSIKVNGEETLPGSAFAADDKPAPVNPYAISKLKAEEGLLELAAETGMEVVIIRPPLVYGPGVKANFQRMMRWIDRGIPLPLGSIQNKRSLVALENLINLIVNCIENPAAANQIFLVRDDEDLSTTELLQRIALVLGKPARLFPFPTHLIIFAASLLGKKGVAQRLVGSLQVDIAKTRALLDWEPPVSVDEGLRKVADDFKKRSGGL